MLGLFRDTGRRGQRGRRVDEPVSLLWRDQVGPPVLPATLDRRETENVLLGGRHVPAMPVRLPDTIPYVKPHTIRVRWHREDNNILLSAGTGWNSSHYTILGLIHIRYSSHYVGDG